MWKCFEKKIETINGHATWGTGRNSFVPDILIRLNLNMMVRKEEVMHLTGKKDNIGFFPSSWWEVYSLHKYPRGMEQYWFKTSHGIVTHNWEYNEAVVYGAAGWK